MDTSVSQPWVSASGIRYSSLRVLLPPKAKPLLQSHAWGRDRPCRPDARSDASRAGLVWGRKSVNGEGSAQGSWLAWYSRDRKRPREFCASMFTSGGYLMDRREFLEAIAGISALVPGLSLLPGSDQQAFAQAMHARAKAAAKLRTLSSQQDGTVTCIAEILLPQTDTV